MDPSSAVARYLAVLERVADAARAAGRDPAEVRLLPVSKTVPAERIAREWPGLRDAGCLTLAENRVQEAAAKAAEVPGPRWAVIGPLQTNKAGQLAAFADEFQALDRPKVAAALQRRLAAEGRTLDVLVQVNTSGEPQKGGVAPEDAAAFVADFGADGPYPNLRLRGFMTMAMLSDDRAAVRGCFSRLRELRDRIAADAPDGVDLGELSMGMSGDFEEAIAEGSTTVRVGRAIFGERPPVPSRA